MRWFLALAALALAGSEPLQISVAPSILLHGQTMTVMCAVQPHKDNEWLDIVVDNYIGSGRQLKGEKAQVVHLEEFTNIPCGIDRVYCELGKTDSRHERRSMRIQVGGCDNDAPATK